MANPSSATVRLSAYPLYVLLKKMKPLLITICLFNLVGSLLSAESLPVTLEVYNSLRIPAHRVKISLQGNGSLNLEIQNMKSETRHSTHTVENKEIERIKENLNRINWKHVKKDNILGLDGTSVRVTYMGDMYTIWTPSYDTEERGLAEYLNLMNELYSLAGLTSSGLPQESEGNKSREDKSE